MTNMLFVVEQQPHKHKIVIAGNHELGFGACDGYIERDTLSRLWGKTVTASFFQRVKYWHSGSSYHVCGSSFQTNKTIGRVEK